MSRLQFAAVLLSKAIRIDTEWENCHLVTL